jgi:predicted transcriptional regulator
MLFRDRPLDPDGLDADLYAPRPALEEALLRPLRQGRNVLLVGAVGSGKTTLLHQARGALEREGTATAWVNAALADDAEELLEAIAVEVGGGHRLPVNLLEAETPHSHLLLLVRALASYPPTVIFLDGLSEARLGFDLFGRLRDELWAAGHTWAVAVRRRDAASLRTPPAEAFWSTTVEIPPLSYEEVDELLRRGLEPAERARLAADRPIGGQYPRLLIREVAEQLESEPGERRARVGELIERAGDVGRSEAMAMAELVALGRPATAHDPELLERLGWSRAYAQRILSHLEREGLVNSYPEAGAEHTGRPRKLYEPDPRALA